MKRILFLLFSVCLFVSCSNEIPADVQEERQGRTLMAYLVSNNQSSDLDSYLKYNVVSMYYSLIHSEKPCALTVYYRPKPLDTDMPYPCILSFESDGKGQVNNVAEVDVENIESLIADPWQWGSFPTSRVQEAFSEIFKVAYVKKQYESASHVATDPVVMRQVIADMQAIFPSNTYGMIYGSHGTGWMKGVKTVARSFGDDGGYSIDVPELAAVLENSFSAGKLDYVLFDACMMGTAEVAYELRNATRYCIASVMETPAEGFPYKYLMKNLYADSPNYQELCTTFADNFKNEWGTCAVVDCSKMEGLATAVSAQLQEHADRLQDFDVHSVQQYGENSYRNFSFDVGDFVRQLNGGVIPASFQQALDEAVIAKSCVERTFITIRPDAERFCGIGMYLPGMVSNVSSSWESYYASAISWNDAVGWNTWK